MKTDSLLMCVCKKLGLESLAWSLRRLHCPVPEGALVLEVGSGGSPYPRANVLLDAYENTRERHWVPLKADRPIVLGFVEKLPFRDKAFDFVIASHVLEHSADPAAFLAELERVAKAGYIEVPDAFFERINPYPDHRLEITSRNGGLVIRKKPKWKVEEETTELYEDRAKNHIALELIPKRPFAFHTRYYWEGHIDFKVLNPEVDASWPAVASGHEPPPLGCVDRLRGRVLDMLRRILSQSRRNKNIDLASLLLCPSCGGSPLSMNPEAAACAKCGAAYPLKNGIPAMFAPGKTRQIK